MANKIAGPNGGVYVIYHAVNKMVVWVGETADFERRHKFTTRMGLRWKVVRKMPGSTKQERVRAEFEVATAWKKRGYAICSHYYGGGTLEGPHADQIRQRISASKKGWAPSADHRAAISRANKGRKLSPGHVAKLVAANTGSKRTPESRARISAALKGKGVGRKVSLQTRAKMSRNQRRIWRERRAARRKDGGVR